MRSEYKPPAEDALLKDVDDSVFLFEKLGKCVVKHRKKFTEGDREDIIAFDPLRHEEELTKNFKISKTASPEIRARIKSIVTEYWDSFCAEGARRPIIGYEFSINTGTHTPVCK